MSYSLRCWNRPPRDEEEAEEELVQQPSTEEEEKDKKAKKQKEEELFKAIQEKNVDKIKEFVHNCDHDVKNVKVGPSKKTVLHLLAENTWEIQEEEKLNQIFTLFYEKDCSVDAKDEYGNTPLKLAAEKGNNPILKLLLDHKADVNAKDNQQGDAPLHWAARKDKVEAIDILIKNGQAKVNIQNKSLKTPLHHAVESNSKNAVLLLLYYKADPTQENKDHEPPLRYAETNDLSDIEKLLKEYKPSETFASFIEYAEENKCSEVVKLFKKPSGPKHLVQVEHVAVDSGFSSNNRSVPHVTVNNYVKVEGSGTTLIGDNPMLQIVTSDGNQYSMPPALPGLADTKSSSSASTLVPTAPPEEVD
ncbi:poly [ADP-ribose] polymerase tankyrase-1 isoform X2 [Exaiptasia diaphana]|uniref:Uncharacterized protein n=1 Tax=Exaiptasia diaphana TaxID=2652724 RepID=A0A913Y7C4_EXADI|nr:poly [ADP-ribose] polymerase tankyrase-1 isoform X2 [Exaiptasia diaphana]